MKFVHTANEGRNGAALFGQERPTESNLASKPPASKSRAEMLSISLRLRLTYSDIEVETPVQCHCWFVNEKQKNSNKTLSWLVTRANMQPEAQRIQNTHFKPTELHQDDNPIALIKSSYWKLNCDL